MCNINTSASRTYNSGNTDSELALTRINNSGDNNEAISLRFRVSTNNQSNNSESSISHEQTSTGGHQGRMQFNLRKGNGSRYKYMTLDSEQGFVWNEDGLSFADFRVETDNNANALIVDAGTERVGFFTTNTDANTNYSNNLCGNVALGTYSQSLSTIATSSTVNIDIPYSRLGRGTYEFALFGFQDGGATQAGCVVHLYVMTNPNDRSHNVISSRSVTVTTSNNSGNLRVKITNNSSTFAILQSRYCVRRMC